MQYKLIGNNDTTNIIQSVLKHRGIDDYNTYLNLNSNDYDDYSNLDNIHDAVKCFTKHFENKDVISILCDTDTDGMCSATIMWKYIKLMDSDYPVHIITHQKNKSHGLASWDFDIPKNTKLLIIPDAGSNDSDECQKLIDEGIAVICLDHHMVNNVEENPAIVVNNQSSINFINKDACGAHVTYCFLRALDDDMWNDYCENHFVDLVALANIADVMNLKSFGTRAMINYGINNIGNKMLKEIIEAQDFSMKGIVSPFTIAFYVSPLINAFLRSATFEERELLVRAFCEDESETFEHTKRGESFPIEESIYEHCVRIAKSYQGKQNRSKDKAVNMIMKHINQYTDDKVIIIDVTETLDSAFTGLVAIKISESANKPVLLVRNTQDGYSGSGRAFNYCPIEDFRALVEECPESTLSQGHHVAFGTNIKDIDKAREWFNEKLKNVSFEKVYNVDFVVDSEDMQVNWCQELDRYKTTFANGVEEPLWAIKNLHISNSNAKIVGKNLDTIQIYDAETNVKYIMFKCDESNEVFDWINNNWDESEIDINIIGTLGLNEYQGIYTPNVIIKDCELVKED